MRQRIHPDDRDRVRETVQEAVRQKTDFTTEFKILLPDGTVKYLEGTSHHLFSSEGALLEAMNSTVDVTQRKRTEQALRESERSLRSAIDGIPGLVAILAPNGDLEAVNRQIFEYCGQSLEELRNWGTNETIHPDDLPHLAEVFTKSIAAGVPYGTEARVRRFDGEFRWFEIRGIPVRDASDRIVRWYSLLTDTEDRTQALARLQQMQSDFAHINRVSMMGELAASLSHEIAATDRQRTQQRPGGPEFSEDAAAGPGRGPGKHFPVSSEMLVGPEKSSIASESKSRNAAAK